MFVNMKKLLLNQQCMYSACILHTGKCHFNQFNWESLKFLFLKKSFEGVKFYRRNLLYQYPWAYSFQSFLMGLCLVRKMGVRVTFERKLTFQLLLGLLMDDTLHLKMKVSTCKMASFYNCLQRI